MSWNAGDYLTHRFNPDLGIGRIKTVEHRALVVEFPRSGTTLRLARTTDALLPVDLSPGRPVRIVETREETTIVERQPDGMLRLANGRAVAAGALWPLALEGALLDRLALGDLDNVEDFITRLDWLHLLAVREADGLGSFLGGRVRLFPHQLYVAERATGSDPVRWLLADEVGLGKTIEAALILNRLVHTRQVERCLIVAPDALTVQWLGELWRKYHQVFTLLDAQRLADVERDFGAGFNPFELHRRSVIALEMLVERPHLTSQAIAAGIDLLVVDEAQRLRRPPGHPGEPAWRAVAPIAALGRHVLLLSATPLEDDAFGFFRLLQLLRPDDFPEDISLEDRLASGTPLPPCTSATRRVDIGGLPPRVGTPIDLDARGGWSLRAQIEGELRGSATNAGTMDRQQIPNAAGTATIPNDAGTASRIPDHGGTASGVPNHAGTTSRIPAHGETASRIPAHGGDPVARRKKAERIRRVLSSGAALRSLLPIDDPMRRQLDSLDASDPRLLWLLVQVRRWRDSGDKTLIFVAHRETLEMLRSALADRAQIQSGLFHEELSPARRDTEVVRFRAPDGPSLLVSTECGGEGRNFEFCRRLILWDLPWRPSLVEQRIGRLDRIGRQIPVEIVYFRPPSGVGRDVVTLFEGLGLFREPMAGVEPQLAPLENALEELALEADGTLSPDRLEALIADARAARSRIREAAYQQLHRDPFRPELAAGLLARIPPDLDALNEHVVVRACARLGFGVERPRGRRKYAIEFGNDALVDSLPGVPGGSTFVGTFDREAAVEDETLDFFASGHPLVEGVFAHLEESPLGRVARFEINPGRGSFGDDDGLIAVYKEGRGFDIVALDSTARERPDWVAALRRRPLPIRPLAADATARTVSRLGRHQGQPRLRETDNAHSRRDDDKPRATDAGPEHGWRQTVRRLAAHLDPSRRPHAVAWVVVRGTAVRE
jgi:ATP-dependent helicase HepA